MSWTAPSIDISAAPLPASTLMGSYISVADADAYFASSFNSAQWTALTTADREIALKQATMWLDQLCWQGERCSDTQAQQWPRKIDATGCCAAVACTTLPPQLVQATSELALALQNNNTAIIGSGGGQQIKSASLGSMSVTYADGATNTKVSGSAPLVLQKFPWLVDLLGPCLMKTSAGGARVLHRECVSTRNSRFY